MSVWWSWSRPRIPTSGTTSQLLKRVRAKQSTTTRSASFFNSSIGKSSGMSCPTTASFASPFPLRLPQVGGGGRENTRSMISREELLESGRQISADLGIDANHFRRGVIHRKVDLNRDSAVFDVHLGIGKFIFRRRRYRLPNESFLWQPTR